MIVQFECLKEGTKKPKTINFTEVFLWCPLVDDFRTAILEISA